MRTPQVDSRLARGAILLVEDDPLVRTTMVMMLRKPALVGRKFVVIAASSVKEMKERLAPQQVARERRDLPRPALCGFFVDFQLAGETALEVLEFLDVVYPFTPGVLYTGGDERERVMATSTARQMHSLQKPFGGEQLRSVIEELFLPYDEERLAFRRFLIELTAARFGRIDPKDLPEHLMRVAEARGLDELDRREGAVAHGVKDSTLESYLLELKDRLGMSIEKARKEFRRTRHGRGKSLGRSTPMPREAAAAPATPDRAAPPAPTQRETGPAAPPSSTPHEEPQVAPPAPTQEEAATQDEETGPAKGRPSAMRGRKGPGPDRVH